MVSPAVSHNNVVTFQNPHLLQPLKPTPKMPSQRFDAKFVARRLREHRAWQEKETRRRCNEILDELEPLLSNRGSRTNALPFPPEGL